MFRLFTQHFTAVNQEILGSSPRLVNLFLPIEKGPFSHFNLTGATFCIFTFMFRILAALCLFIKSSGYPHIALRD